MQRVVAKTLVDVGTFHTAGSHRRACEQRAGWHRGWHIKGLEQRNRVARRIQQICLDAVHVGGQYASRVDAKRVVGCVVDPVVDDIDRRKRIVGRIETAIRAAATKREWFGVDVQNIQLIIEKQFKHHAIMRMARSLGKAHRGGAHVRLRNGEGSREVAAGRSVARNFGPLEHAIRFTVELVAAQVHDAGRAASQRDRIRVWGQLCVAPPGQCGRDRIEHGDAIASAAGLPRDNDVGRGERGRIQLVIEPEHQLAGPVDGRAAVGPGCDDARAVLVKRSLRRDFQTIIACRSHLSTNTNIVIACRGKLVHQEGVYRRNACVSVHCILVGSDHSAAGIQDFQLRVQRVLELGSVDIRRKRFASRRSEAVHVDVG